MSEKDNIDLVQQIYGEFKSGNIQGLLDKLDGNITWELPKMENVPFSGKRNGREAVAEFFALVGASQEVLRFEPIDFVAQGNRVVALGNYEWRILESGRTFTGNWAHAFTIENGAVTDFAEYTDTAAAERAYHKTMSA